MSLGKVMNPSFNHYDQHPLQHNSHMYTCRHVRMRMAHIQLHYKDSLVSICPRLSSNNNNLLK